MNPFTNIIDLLTMVFSKFHITNWTVSLNGAAKGPVTSAKVGIKNTSVFWANMNFTVDGVAHILTGERSLLGGVSTVTLDGVAVPNAHIALSKHIQGFPPHLKVEVDFDLVGATYRFDGRVS